MYIYKADREIYQAPACIYTKQIERSIDRRHVYTKTRQHIYHVLRVVAPRQVPKAGRHAGARGGWNARDFILDLRHLLR